MPKQLSDRQQRVILGLLVVVLIGFGVYLYVSASGDDPEDEATPEEQDEEAAPLPLPVTDTEDLEFFDWLPFSEEEFLEAGVVAREFTAAYGTFDATEGEEAAAERLGEWATEDFAEFLRQSSGAGARQEELADSETVAEGRAEVEGIRHFDADSIVFVVQAQSIAEDSDGAEESLGDFAVTVVEEGGAWRVHDFQPADAGDWGEER
jgi:hypothetical protein